MKRTEPLIFELSQSGRGATAQHPPPASAEIPAAFRRRGALPLPEVSELQAVRHYTRLSQMNFGIDTQFYPLGSCTMKYNPRVCNSLAMLPVTPLSTCHFCNTNSVVWAGPCPTVLYALWKPHAGVSAC